jgi:hypothetical protein
MTNKERSARLDALESSLEDCQVIARANTRMIDELGRRIAELQEQLASEAV